MWFLDLLKDFEDNDIVYAIAGGFAVSLHGAIRGTLDLDLVIALNRQSYEKAEQLLNSHGLIARLPVNAAQVFDFREEYIKNRNLIAWSFYCPHQQSKQVVILIPYDGATMKADKIRLVDQSIRVLCIAELIQMKKQAGRPQDLVDIEALERIAREKKGNSSR